MAAAVPKTADAWYYSAHGDPKDVLKRGSLPVQPVGPTDVLVRVKAAALNPVDIPRILGVLFAPKELPAVPGVDFAGEVVEVGADVTRVKPGDSVYGDTFTGTLSTYAVAGQNQVAIIPKGWSFEEAASLPIALLTAWGVFEKAGFKAGQSLVITAGAGGVGVYAIQLAKALGASRIVTTASSEKHELLKSLGATETVDYRTQNIEEVLAGSNFDLGLDSTKESSKLLKAVAPGSGKVITIIDFPPPKGVEAFQTNTPSSGADLDKLAPLLEAGKIKPILDPAGPFKFDDVPEAVALQVSKRAKGKIVVTVA